MILIISNSRDFATDHVIAQLIDRREAYLRIDLDLLSTEAVSLDPVTACLTLTRSGRDLRLAGHDIRSIYYRAPTHLCESSGGRYPPAELLARHQWAAFARGLSVFDGAFWVNHPWHTYRAESKAYQLRAAAKVGFRVPETRVCNAPPNVNDAVWGSSATCAVKALDTFLLRVNEGEDAFFYTRSMSMQDLATYSLETMPLTMQQLIEPKTDLRVTVIGGRAFAAAIRRGGSGVVGDWRLSKDTVTYERYDLPGDVLGACIRIVADLGLVFGAIDLAVRGEEYYFLEINPTGEWAWLVDHLRLPIAEEITDALCAGRVPPPHRHL